MESSEAVEITLLWTFVDFLKPEYEARERVMWAVQCHSQQKSFQRPKEAQNVRSTTH